MDRWRSALLRASAVALASGLLGAALQLTLRDRLPLLRTLYYGLPWPLIAGLGLVAVPGFLRARARRATLAGLALGGASLASWLAGSLGPGAVPAPPGARVWRAACWNVARRSQSEALASLREWDPDLICLVEGPRRGELATAFPERAVVLARGGLGVVLRPGIAARSARWMRLGHAGQLGRVELDLGGRGLTLLLVDMVSNPLRDRGPAFAALEEQLARTPGPVLVLGDWNTPPGSVHFQGLRARGLEDAFAAAGEGLAETWPWPLPALALDHAWGGGGVRFRACQRRWRAVSDHRAAWVEWWQE